MLGRRGATSLSLLRMPEVRSEALPGHVIRLCEATQVIAFTTSYTR